MSCHHGVSLQVPPDNQPKLMMVVTGRICQKQSHMDCRERHSLSFLVLFLFTLSLSPFWFRLFPFPSLFFEKIVCLLRLALQTAEIVFGYYDTLDRTLVHRGAYKEDPNEHIRNLRNLFLNLPVENGKNTIVSSHNSVIHIDMFDESVLKDDQFELEEGGFYVISNNNGVLKLEHSFYYFRDFIINFYPRG